MLNELRLAFRSLRNSPGFSLVAIITVALAIGASTAVFSLVNALLIRPLPYQAPEQLVLLWEKFSAQGLDRIPVSAPEYLDYTKEIKSLEIAAVDYVDLNLTAGEIPERISGAAVTPSLFTVLGVQPSKGRVFTPSALSALLYNVGAFDLPTFVIVTLVLALVALAASYLPALRATKADPMIALTHVN